MLEPPSSWFVVERSSSGGVAVIASLCYAQYDRASVVYTSKFGIYTIVIPTTSPLA
jgi:hypothetical protein